MIKQISIFSVIALTLVLGLSLIALPIYASGDLVQVANNVSCGTTATSDTLAFSSSVTSGDILVAQVTVYSTSAITLNTPTDTLSNSFSSQVTQTKSANGLVATTEIWTTTTGSSGADTISYTSTTSITWCGLFNYELTNVITTGITTASGSGTSSAGANNYQVSPALTIQAFTIAGLMSFSSSDVTGLTPTASYTLVASNTLSWGSEYGTANGDTSMLMSYNSGEISNPYVIAAISFPSSSPPTTTSTVTTITSATTTYSTTTTTTLTVQSLTTTTTTTSTTTTSTGQATLDTYAPAWIDFLIFIVIIASALTVIALMRKQLLGSE